MVDVVFVAICNAELQAAADEFLSAREQFDSTENERHGISNWCLTDL